MRFKTMDKKNTVIVTVLVNAGLLLVLFVTAISKDSSQSRPTSPDVVVTEPLKEMEALQPIYSGEALQEKSQEHTKQFVAIEQEPAKQPRISTASEPVIVTKEEKIVHKLPQMQEEKAAEIAAVIQPPQKTMTKEVIVKKGDNLEKLAKRHHSTVSEIKLANHLTSHLLRIGQVLIIPQKDSVATVNTNITQKSEAEYYVVKAGDNPWTIAMKHHLKVSDLLRMNDLDQNKAKRLRPGDRLRIR